MELFVTKNSPYARIVRVVTYELDIEDSITVSHAKTRKADSPYYTINPSGRVPYLVSDNGIGIEGTDTICEYLCAALLSVLPCVLCIVMVLQGLRFATELTPWASLRSIRVK